MKLNIAIAVLLLIQVGCKSTKNTSDSKEVTPFSQTNQVDLTRYKDADQTVFDNMKLEMKKHKFNYNTLRSKVDAITTIPSGVDKDELVAIRLYTSSAYTEVNKALRTRDPSSLPEMENIIKAASSGLNNLPSSPCTAKRGTNLPADVLNALQKNTQFIECAFLSTTYGDIPPAFRKDITFEIESNNCAKIDWLSEFPNEKEVLFPPGSEFMVTDRTDTKVGSKTRTFIKLKHVMSGDAEIEKSIRKIDCKSIIDRQPSQ